VQLSIFHILINGIKKYSVGILYLGTEKKVFSGIIRFGTADTRWHVFTLPLDN